MLQDVKQRKRIFESSLTNKKRTHYLGNIICVGDDLSEKEGNASFREKESVNNWTTIFGIPFCVISAAESVYVIIVSPKILYFADFLQQFYYQSQWYG